VSPSSSRLCGVRPIATTSRTERSKSAPRPLASGDPSFAAPGEQLAGRPLDQCAVRAGRQLAAQGEHARPTCLVGPGAEGVDAFLVPRLPHPGPHQPAPVGCVQQGGGVEVGAVVEEVGLVRSELAIPAHAPASRSAACDTDRKCDTSANASCPTS
jgi:hypothetical protein